MKTFNKLLIELSLGKVMSFADVAHTGQHRKTSGAPYITHPMTVVRILQRLGVKDRNILAAAGLHDTLEDTPVTYNEIKKNFNKEIANIVKDVTSVPKSLAIQGKEAYLANKMLRIGSGSLLIKLADRLHNVDDLDKMSADKAQKYADQTFYIIQRLKDKRKLNKFQRKIIRKIEKKISKYKKSDIDY